MGKTLKYTLMVVYVLQLSMMFRETVVHVYHYALEKSEMEKTRIAQRVNGMQEFLKSVAQPEARVEHTLAGTHSRYNSFLLLLFAVDIGGEEAEEDHREKDSHDREKRGRKRIPGEHIVANLYPGFKKLPFPAGASGDGTNTIMRVLAFGTIGKYA